MGSAHVNVKESVKKRQVRRAKKKGIEVQLKSRTSTRAMDAQIGNWSKKKKKKKKQRAPNPATLDHSVASYDPQGLHGKPILLTSPGYKGDKYLFIIIY